MKLFGKRQRAEFVASDGTEYVAVPTEEIKALVAPLGNKTAARMDEPMACWVDLLQVLCFARVVGHLRDETLEPTNDQVRWARTAARLGYLFRIVEFETLNEDDHNSALAEWIRLVQRKSEWGEEWFQAVGGITQLLLKLSIENRNEPDAEKLLAPTGLGHDVHTEMSIDSLGRIIMDEDDKPRDLEGVISPRELGHCWRYGYYLRACEMSLPEEAKEELAAMDAAH
jgi:hypothetical protein